MKKLLTIILLSSIGLAVSAQSRAFNQKLFDAKLAEMVQQLHITETQRPLFLQIYEDYSRDMIRVWNENQPSGDEPVEQMRAQIARQEQTQALRLRYLDRLSAVLTDEQLPRFFTVEKSIQQRLKSRVAAARQ